MSGKVSLLATVSISALVFCVSGGVAADRKLAAPRMQTLHDQNSYDSGVAIISTDFDDGDYDSYDSQGADDFTVPKGHAWVIKRVIVSGRYIDGGLNDGVNVFYL